MKTIIAGSRNCTDYGIVLDAIYQSGFKITEVVSGCARGVDTFGEQWATEKGIPIKQFPADWKKYKKAAGPIRNKQMAEYADALVAVLFKKSRGTENMVEQAMKMRLNVFVLCPDRPEGVNIWRCNRNLDKLEMLNV